MSIALRLTLPLLLCVVCSCADTGGSYSSGHSSRYYDPWYYNGGYYYNDGIYVPDYPDRNPGDIPDRPDSRPRPSHPIVKPDRPSARPTPSIPTRTRPMSSPRSSSFSRGSGMRGGGMRGGRGGRGR